MVGPPLHWHFWPVPQESMEGGAELGTGCREAGSGQAGGLASEKRGREGQPAEVPPEGQESMLSLEVAVLAGPLASGHRRRPLAAALSR